MNAEPPCRECYTDFALQEYIAGRLDVQIRSEVAGHLEACPECCQALSAFEAEARLLQSALAPLGPSSVGEDIPDETLALYLGGALSETQVLALEAALGRDAVLMRRLIAIRMETSAARAELDYSPSAASESEPKGQILKMPRRIRPVATLLAIRRAGGGRAG